MHVTKEGAPDFVIVAGDFKLDNNDIRLPVFVWQGSKLAYESELNRRHNGFQEVSEDLARVINYRSSVKKTASDILDKWYR